MGTCHIRLPKFSLAGQLRHVGRELRKQAEKIGFDLTQVRGWTRHETDFDNTPFAEFTGLRGGAAHYRVVRRTGRSESV